MLPVQLTVGYAVSAVDLSGDGRLDIAIVDSKRFIWLENPTWQMHVMHAEPEAANDNVCFAAHDVDGDGDTDFAVGRDWQFGNSDSGGHVGWLRCPDDPRSSWEYYPITQEPTTHRMRWIDWAGDGSRQLVVSPLKGRGSRPPGFDDVAIRLLLLTPPQDPAGAEWKIDTIADSLHVCHNIDVVDFDGDGREELLAASFEGVTRLWPADGQTQTQRLGSGFPDQPPRAGASEVRLGTLGRGRYIATIEPWHGDHVVVYTPPAGEGDSLWTRHVLDAELKWGHAVACTNVDGDPDQELIIGVRDELSAQHRAGVRIYDPQDAVAGKWKRSLIEPGQVAVEDLAVADFDADGDTDIIAVGRATHNAVIYWNEGTD